MTQYPWSEQYKNKIVEPKDLADWAEKIRAEKLKIATINGSFDLLHAGHLHMLYEASLQGDKLLVALNSDTSIKQYKSPLRPIIPLTYRLQMMAALSFVDFITWFDEIDPCTILSVIKPDVHINGSEYGPDCIEAPIVTKGGGRVHIVSLIPGLSTSQIIEKIKETCA